MASSPLESDRVRKGVAISAEGWARRTARAERRELQHAEHVAQVDFGIELVQPRRGCAEAGLSVQAGRTVTGTRPESKVCAHAVAYARCLTDWGIGGCGFAVIIIAKLTHGAILHCMSDTPESCRCRSTGHWSHALRRFQPACTRILEGTRLRISLAEYS